MYKVWWKLTTKYTEDGYFYKKKEIANNYKYLQNYSQAYDLLQEVKKSIITLGLGDMGDAGIDIEEETPEVEYYESYD